MRSVFFPENFREFRFPQDFGRTCRSRTLALEGGQKGEVGQKYLKIKDTKSCVQKLGGGTMTQSFIGRAGLALDVKCPNNRGNAYVRASVLHDWQGDASFTYSQANVGTRKVSQDLGDTWYEFGLGANVNLTKQTHLYADVEMSNGGEVETDYRFNLGVRYAW
ncbi:MAG: autotransporter outer membrane beta-barrel domain-containing protein [Sutterellaceae bacterium]|nr:autotransporter outer membrane beta-barrel domain-containing protein [Sutterellaceae bacterium]